MKNSPYLDRPLRTIAEVEAERAKLTDETSLLPEMVADRICQEAAWYLSSDTPLAYADALAARAEHLYERNSRYRSLLRGKSGMEYMECFYRHWLSAALKREHPSLYRRLPTQFSNGAPIGQMRETSAAFSQGGWAAHG